MSFIKVFLFSVGAFILVTSIRAQDGIITPDDPANLQEGTDKFSAVLGAGKYKQIELKTISVGYGGDLVGNGREILSRIFSVAYTYPAPAPFLVAELQKLDTYRILVNGKKVVNIKAPEAADPEKPTAVYPLSTSLINEHFYYESKAKARRKAGELALFHLYKEETGGTLFSDNSVYVFTVNGSEMARLTSAELEKLFSQCTKSYDWFGFYKNALGIGFKEQTGGKYEFSAKLGCTTKTQAVPGVTVIWEKSVEFNPLKFN